MRFSPSPPCADRSPLLHACIPHAYFPMHISLCMCSYACAKVCSRVRFPSFGFGTRSAFPFQSRVQFPSLGFGTRSGNHSFPLFPSLPIYIPHHPLVPSSHTIPISPDVVPPCSYLPDRSLPRHGLQLSYINPPVMYLVPRLK
jgi:hypothetical protein